MATENSPLSQWYPYMVRSGTRIASATRKKTAASIRSVRSNRGIDFMIYGGASCQMPARVQHDNRNFASISVFTYLNNMKARILFSIAIGTLLAVGRLQAQTSPPSPADVKALAKGGVSDEVILSQIRNSHAVYHLNTADILDLKESGVSEKVIDFMINTSAAPASAPPPAPVPATPAPTVVNAPPSPPGSPTVEVVEGSAPPPPVVETVTVSPGPGYIWVGGFWTWRHHHWDWVSGRWAYPPRYGAVWVDAHWDHRWGRTVWVDGYWR